MILQCPCQLSFLWIVLLLLPQDGGDCCRPPAWAAVQWENLEDVEELKNIEELWNQKASDESYCLRDLVCQLWPTFPGLPGYQDGIFYGGCTIILLIVYKVLRCLLSRWNKPVLAETPSDILNAATTETHETHEEHTTKEKIKLLYSLAANTSKMMKYMKYIVHHHKKEKYQKFSKKRKADQVDEDNESYFPVCSHHHSSSGDVTMHEI